MILGNLSLQDQAHLRDEIQLFLQYPHYASIAGTYATLPGFHYLSLYDRSILDPHRHLSNDLQKTHSQRIDVGGVFVLPQIKRLSYVLYAIQNLRRQILR